MRMLIIEDQKETREFLRSSFGEEGFVVDTASDGIEGSYLARVNDYDIIILDHILPGKDGFMICNEIRRAGKHMPILMLSVKSEIDHKVKLFGEGIDDYVVKPFSFNELQARVKAILRRPKEVKADILKVDDLVIDTDQHSVARGKKKIYLTRKEFSLLSYLMSHKGKVLSRGMIMEHVWSAESDPFSNTIEAHILNLRKKLEPAGKKKLIHAIPGRGYKLDVEK